MKYLKYILKNIEPLRIADDSISQSGQAVTLRYIPGTTMKGYVINSLVKNNPEIFEENKRELFSDKVCFLNAYPYENGKELIPSPKGFYEDKTGSNDKKEISNVVVDGEFTEGQKRASLGRFCYLENNCIHYYSVKTESDMKIKINQGKQNVFRNEYIARGNKFVGYIAFENDGIGELISSSITDEVILGNARSQGLGKCVIEKKEILKAGEFPYGDYAAKSEKTSCCYMMLLSNTVMRDDYGNYDGINLEELEKKLGVDDLNIEFCSTSIVNVRGYNRQWGVKIPSVNMYEQGSVFKLSYTGTASTENMNNIMNFGLGIKKNDGCGRVIFLENYEAINCKKEEVHKNELTEAIAKNKDDDATIKIIAENYYRTLIFEAIQNRVLDGVNKCDRKGLLLKDSQVGKVRSILETNKYNPMEGTEIVHNYFEHAKEKQDSRNVQKQKASIEPFMKQILYILDNPLQSQLGLNDIKSVMGIPVCDLIGEEELQRSKFEYILELIKYDNRKGEK